MPRRMPINNTMRNITATAGKEIPRRHRNLPKLTRQVCRGLDRTEQRMCGIAGIIGTKRDDLVDAAVVHRMCQSIAHRGPDDEGVYVHGRIGLGMRRLSIIDLSTGQQPVHNEDCSVWVVFNGEIYNFAELRARLQARGHHFYTKTDTEVIVHLYEDCGSDCVHSLQGMFAFALWDQRQQRLLLARDRFGKKPLHYALTSGKLLFASEIKAILAAAPDLANVNP